MTAGFVPAAGASDHVLKELCGMCCCVYSWVIAEAVVCHVMWFPLMNCKQGTGGGRLEAGSIGRDGEYMHRDPRAGEGEVVRGGVMVPKQHGSQEKSRTMVSHGGR